jgi:hypothetical protein
MFKLLVFVAAFSCASIVAAPKGKVKAWTDEAKAKVEYSDYDLQGEYKSADGAIQVAAMPQNTFHVVSYRGGLPAFGWDGNKPGSEMLDAAGVKKVIAGLERIERKSPTLGEKPPAGAVVLFDGKTNKMEGKVEDGLLWAGAKTKDQFGSFKLHMEFRLPFKPDRMVSNQDRGNSGVYIFNRYECQVLDSFTAPHAYGRELAFKAESDPKQWCASFYKFKYPDNNVSLPALRWQTYDIEFTAPKFENGKKVANARISVRHNGVLVHDDVELEKGTGNGGRRPEVPEESIYLQNHGNPVAYRNMWIVRK